jgi:transcription initiation factor TFIIB
MAELDRLTDMLHIPASIKERAAMVYRKGLDNGLVRGRPIAAMTAASLYAACRMSETQRTLKDVSAASRIRKKDVARFYRLLVRELDMRMPVLDPVRCISKIATKVEISMLTQQRAIRIINEARNKGIVTGKDPMGLAAASLYVACVLEGERKTQKEIAEVANVTEVTVRNRYKGLKEAMQPYGSSRSGKAMLTRRAASVTAESQPLYSKPEDRESVVNLVNCAKCGKAIEAGKEVKKGWMSKKTYHADCAPK